VAFTYNDPVVFMEYAIDVAAACRAAGVKTVAVTAGYVAPKPRVELFAAMDAANVDLKAFTEDFYARTCGAHLQPVLETLEYLVRETKVWVEITTLLIPGMNDSEAEIDAMTSWVLEHLGPDVPHHFTAFHPDWKMREPSATPASTLKRARAIAKRNGLRYVYTGNVHDPEGQSTHCPGCDGLLIGRDGYEILEWGMGHDGRCRFCGARCPGTFDEVPGSWGARRLPVHLAAS
jgi:pyruvate formate lyase activating enzyme